MKTLAKISDYAGKYMAIIALIVSLGMTAFVATISPLLGLLAGGQ